MKPSICVKGVKEVLNHNPANCQIKDDVRPVLHEYWASANGWQGKKLKW
jgi:hypothetical protein